jgi:uncharacterized membrane protein YidH (DUF202 family)
MTVLTGVGVFLVVIGVVEFVIFGRLAKREESIRRKRTLLNLNSAFNVVLGIVLIAIGVS